MMRTLAEINLSADLENLSKFRSLIQASLNKLRLNESAINQITLVLSEVTTNFIEHSQTATQVGVKLSISANKLELKVFEFSAVNNYSALSEWISTTTNDNYDFDSFCLDRSGGRGGSLVASLTDAIALMPTQKSGTQNNTSFINGVSLAWNLDKIIKKKRILIVDDDLVSSSLHASYLENDFETVCTDSAENALSILNKNEFDLIVSDLHMPTVDGVKFRNRVSSLNTAINTPFIFLSGDVDADQNLSLSRLGIDGFLTKPISKNHLLQSISRILTRAQQISEINDQIHTRSITKSLQPSIPTRTGNWRIEATSDGPGTGGGDLLIVKEYENSVFIVVADLIGHDMAAKFFSHAYLGYMRGVLCASPKEPEQFLSLLSDAIIEDELLSQTMCTCCAIKLFDDGKLRIASAGHPPPLIISGTRSVHVMSGGMLPGILPNMVYASEEHQLNIGERIAVFTDGFIDPSNLSDSEEEKHLHEAVISELTQTLARPLKSALGSTFDLVKKGRGKRQIDDTLLVLAEIK